MANKVHIGYPKTATTFLQRHVFPKLENHHFIGHPEFRASGLIDLVWKADRSIEYDRLKLRFQNQNNFVSFEDLSGPTFQGSMLIDEIPKRLAKIFGGETKILITIRNQIDLIRSIYTQYIHQGGTLSLKAFIKQPILGNNRIDLNAFNFFETYNRYAEVFGESNIYIIPYELLLSEKENYFKNLNIFFENESLEIPRRMKLENRSLEGLQLSIMRYLNRYLMSPISEKYIISPTLLEQSKLRFNWQKSDFLRLGYFFSKEDLRIISEENYRYINSNRNLDSKLKLNLSKYGYY